MICKCFMSIFYVFVVYICFMHRRKMTIKKEELRRAAALIALCVLSVLAVSLSACEMDPVEDIVQVKKILRQEKAIQSDPCAEYPMISLRDVCHFNLAIGNRSIQHCLMINDTSQKDECFVLLAGIREDSELCDAIGSQAEKDRCNFNMAISGEDPLSCSEIMSQEGKYSKNRCYFLFAVKLKDEGICSKIVDEEMFTENKCVESVSQY